MSNLQDMYNFIMEVADSQGAFIAETKLDAIISEYMFDRIPGYQDNEFLPLDEARLEYWSQKWGVTLCVLRRNLAKLYIYLSYTYYLSHVNNLQSENIPILVRAHPCARKALSVIGLSAEEAYELVYGTTDEVLIALLGVLGLSKHIANKPTEAKQYLEWCTSLKATSGIAHQIQMDATTTLKILR